MNTEGLSNSGDYIVNWNNEADLNVSVQVVYIKSGEQDIQKYVSEVVTPQLNEVVSEAREQAEAASEAVTAAENILFFTQSASEAVSERLGDVGDIGTILDEINGEVV
ncbi:MAG: hypothetical protein J6039_03010 [Alphaproteobacteria bacterium]|nr:hypothetical protein [Alphaproteobacteria bacterium]